MKLVSMDTDMSKKYSESSIHSNRKEAILKRHAERKKLERNGVFSSNLSEVEKFTEVFHKKHKAIDRQLELLNTMSPDDHVGLAKEITAINIEIQELQKLFSNATLFLRIYDKKVFQESLQALLGKLQNLEAQLLPKKKFGFKVKRNNVEGGDIKFIGDDLSRSSENSNPSLSKFVGISERSNEELTLEGKQIEGMDIMLKDLTDCCIRLKGVPSTLHATNIDRCKMFLGPVTTSVFIENAKNSVLHMACQQLRIHDSVNCDFYVHVTSKTVIENCKDVRFGIYELSYDGIERDYQISGLSKKINNWDKVDDFNWLITNKPSPNWSIITKN